LGLAEQTGLNNVATGIAYGTTGYGTGGTSSGFGQRRGFSGGSGRAGYYGMGPYGYQSMDGVYDSGVQGDGLNNA